MNTRPTAAISRQKEYRSDLHHCPEVLEICIPQPSLQQLDE